jgi:hypothetical protein
MKDARTTKLLLLISGILAMMLVLNSSVMAQCALCKNAVTGSPSAAKLSESLNFAIIVLLIPPVLIFCGIFFVAYRHRKARVSEAISVTADESQDEREAARALASAREQKRRSGSERETGGALA